jgi:hypothetical protein
MDDHRRHAVAFNQRVWALLDKKDLSAEEAEEMVLAAHAGLALWLQAGTGVHHQRGQWLIARVYVELGRLEPARHHLQLTLALTAQHRDALADFDLAFADALAARVHALAGDLAQARLAHDSAEARGNALADPEDRRVFFDQLNEGPWFGLDV